MARENGSIVLLDAFDGRQIREVAGGEPGRGAPVPHGSGIAWVTSRGRLRGDGGWVIDADHLLAKPIYVPNRCSIGFHPLHTTPAILIYGALLVAPPTRLLGLGLSLHIALDAADCARMSPPA